MIVRKKEGKLVRAYRLGEESLVIRELIKKGDIVETGNGLFEVFSQEAVNGSGEKANAGDYVKIDSQGKPYPNSRDFFEKNHKWVSEDEYEQIPVSLQAWTVEEKICEEIKFLLEEKKMEIHEQDEENYFEAFLWGTLLSAPKNAVIIIYDVKKDDAGKIEKIDFNFVRREEFDKTYQILE